MAKKLTLLDKKKIFLNSLGNNLEPMNLTREEIKGYIARQSRILNSFKDMVIRQQRKIEEAKKEMGKRPRSKTYRPGLYIDNTPLATDVFTDQPRWVARDGGLIIVDYEGYPWSYFGGVENDGWHRFGLSMNNTSERVWERVGDL